MFDGAAFGKEMVGIVKGYVSKAMAPVLTRIEALEARNEPLSEDAIRTIANEAAVKSVGELPQLEASPYQPTKDELRSAFQELVAEVIEPAIAALPKPQDGKSVTSDDLRPMISEEVSAAIAASIADAIKSIPTPKDGVDGKNGLDAVTPILKDGVLLFTMSDGSIREVGEVKGKDGQPGRDGIDGLGFDDLSAEYDGERGIVLRFVRGEQTKEFAFTMPVVIDRGVWAEGKDYAAGDAVTWAGSIWIAQKETTAKPDSGDGWRLSVKRGRDGKDGAVSDKRSPSLIRVAPNHA